MQAIDLKSLLKWKSRIRNLFKVIIIMLQEVMSSPLTSNPYIRTQTYYGSRLGWYENVMYL